MAITFNPALPSATDRIRQRIGQTDLVNAKIQDETIQAYLDQDMSELGVAYQLCLDLAALYAGIGNTQIDNQLSRNDQISKHYLDMASVILREMKGDTAGGANTGAIIVGGIGDTRGPLQDCPASSYPTWPYI